MLLKKIIQMCMCSTITMWSAVDPPACLISAAHTDSKKYDFSLESYTDGEDDSHTVPHTVGLAHMNGIGELNK